MEPSMPLKKEFSDLRLSLGPLTLYQKFEQVCVLMLTALIAIIIVLALWNLTLKLLLSILATNFDPTDYEVFQTVFGMIFTVIIALEFKRSLLVVAERRDSVVQVRSVILIALLAVVRKLIILDLSSTDAFHLLALAAAILALGAVYWLVRDQGQSRETILPGGG
ncbi:phosphate-starvation-inducible PsiE family protein [Bradyrhizobium sp. SSUT18]|uniref:phosphate-starvation-inducible PsiE family protein n=1 Tax=unclassified Bradyrhizobium TaxID=2631580 RepID=UPI00244CA373|nr:MULTISPECIES: phosphate-starvation-inducible PsiE family protein [unclassified Bradyrhizobium]MDH2355982.1 phosphate-starvation-inducible PsiE family protein [Bradyrhizobium sp. SSUT112]MDH2398493.1 phosphate-starvation-inducible PsiE family protein [Bradyrhizobium sp. SSUT18]